MSKFWLSSHNPTKMSFSKGLHPESEWPAEYRRVGVLDMGGYIGGRKELYVPFISFSCPSLLRRESLWLGLGKQWLWSYSLRGNQYQQDKGLFVFYTCQAEECKRPAKNLWLPFTHGASPTINMTENFQSRAKTQTLELRAEAQKGGEQIKVRGQERGR